MALSIRENIVDPLQARNQALQPPYAVGRFCGGWCRQCGVIPFPLDYEDVLKRPGLLGQYPWISAEDIDIVLDAVFGCATLTSPWFRFRPFLDDPKDDLYVECALAAGAAVIVSQDKHFDHPSLRAFGLVAMNARDYLVRHHDRSNPE